MTAAQAGDGKQPPSKPANTRLAARIYAEKFKWRVFPVHYPLFTSGGSVYCSCKKRGKCGKRTAKHPVTKNGLKDATTDLRKINAWWDEDTSFNVAVATGAESGIFVLDIDVSDTKHGDDTLEALEEKHGKLPDTVEVITGSGGRHLYFKHPGNIRIKSSVEDEELGKGIDVRGDGGYVLAPPSMHMSGRSYGYEASSRPTDVPLAEAPQWLLDLVKAKPKKVVAPGPPIDDSKWPPLERRVYRAEKYAGAAKGAVSGDGGSNMTLKLALALVVGFVLPSEEALRILEDVYNPKCDPPWSHDELVHKVESCSTSKLARGYLLGSDVGPGDLPPMPEWMDDVPPDLHDQRPVGNASAIPDDVYEKIFKGPAPEPPDVTPPPPPPPPPVQRDVPVPTPEDVERKDRKRRKQQVPPPPADNEPPNPPGRGGGGIGGRGGRRMFIIGDQKEIADFMREDMGVDPLMHDEGDFWRYDTVGGVWSKIPYESLATLAASYSGSPVGRNVVKISSSTCAGASEILEAQLRTEFPDQTFVNARRGIAFKNGFVVVRDGRVLFEPHAKENLCRFSFDFDYDETAPSPCLDEFLDEVFTPFNEDDKAELISGIQQFVGASLIGEAPKYQKCLALFGSGGNGKSQVLEIARAAFPPGTVSALPPQEWGARFQLGRLVGKLANFCDEIPEHDITHGDVFKSVITGEPRHCDIKNKPMIEFTPLAGHIFSANVLPGSKDQSEAFWSRWIVIPLFRNFRTDPGRKLDVGKDIVSKERSAIVSWALRGAAAVQRAGKFEVADVSRRVIEDWRNAADPVRAFLLDPDTDFDNGADTNGYIQASFFYTTFRNWCRNRGFAEMSVTSFGRRMGTCGLMEKVAAQGHNAYKSTKKLDDLRIEVAKSSPKRKIAQSRFPADWRSDDDRLYLVHVRLRSRFLIGCEPAEAWSEADRVDLRAAKHSDLSSRHIEVGGYDPQPLEP